MIKINLLIERGSSSGGGFGGAAAAVGGGAINAADISVKAACLFLPLVGLLIYEQVELSSKAGLKIQKEARAEQLVAEAVALKPQIDAAKKLLEERKRLEQQIDTIKQLSKERLFNIKALNALHTLVPKSVWLNSLKFEKDQVEMKGRSVDSPAVFEFTRKLEESIYFMNVTLGNVTDQSGTDGSIKEFTLKAKLESM